MSMTGQAASARRTRIGPLAPSHIGAVGPRRDRQVLVKGAIMRYVLPGELTDVSHAMARLIEVDIVSRITVLSGAVLSTNTE